MNIKTLAESVTFCPLLLRLAVASLAALPTMQAAASIYETNTTQMANLKLVDELFDKYAAETSKTRFVRRGLIADKERAEVRVLAEACDIAAGATVEFPIVGELSDRDYEALFRTFAAPGDLAMALEMLGVPRGFNVSSSKKRFWPRGERVEIMVRHASGATFGCGDDAFEPVQSYILDRALSTPPKWENFVYCGSPDDSSATDGKRLADTCAPNSILSTYNEAQTVLDVPEISRQSDVYERYVLNKDASFKAFGLYEIVFRPVVRVDESGKLMPRIQNMTLSCFSSTNSSGDVSIAYRLKNGTNLTFYADTASLFGALREFVERKLEPHVALEFCDSLRLSEVQTLARAFDGVEGAGGIRVAEPPLGQIYYKGFLPPESWRNASERVGQPWEAHFSTNSASVRLVKTLEDWSDQEAFEPVLSFKTFEALTASNALEIISREGSDLPVVLIYASPSAKLSSFMPIVRELLTKFPTVHVFGE